MVSRKKILISDDSAEFRTLCQEKLNEKGYEVILKKRDGFEVLSAIEAENPDLVVMDVQMRHIDALGVLKGLKNRGPLPRFIITSSFNNGFIEKALAEEVNCHYMLKPVEFSLLLERIDSLCSEDTIQHTTARQDFVSIQQLEVMVTNILHNIGVPAHIKGYHYLREAIILSLLDPAAMNSVTKQLYPSVGKRFSTTSSGVERAIRHAIEVAWDRGDVDVLNSYFGYTIQNSRGKPTNSEFIAMIADKIRIQIHLENREIPQSNHA